VLKRPVIGRRLVMGRFTLGTHTVCTVRQIFSTGFVVVASVCVCVCLPRLCGCWHCNSVWQELSPKDDRTCFANAAVGIVIPFGRNCLQKMIGRALQMLTLAILLPHPARMTRALDWSQSSDVLLCHADLQQCGASAAAAAVAKNSRKILDVTHTLREDLPIWLGEDGLGRITAPVLSMSRGDHANLSKLKLDSVHTGTHVDAPGTLRAGVL